MTPASIVIPTRERPDYLRVALASIAPQARAAGADPTEEWKRVQSMAKEDAANQAAMTAGDPGGKVDHQNQLPDGAAPKPPPPWPPRTEAFGPSSTGPLGPL